MNKDFSIIASQYNEKLLAEHKANFSTLNNGLSYFITYLRYLRDYYLLTEKSTDSEAQKLKTAALVAAVGEYDQCHNCIKKYYTLNGEPTAEFKDVDTDIIVKKYNEERKYHWTNFWQLVVNGIEGWAVNG